MPPGELQLTVEDRKILKDLDNAFYDGAAQERLIEALKAEGKQLDEARIKAEMGKVKAAQDAKYWTRAYWFVFAMFTVHMLTHLWMGWKL